VPLLLLRPFPTGSLFHGFEVGYAADLFAGILLTVWFGLVLATKMIYRVLDLTKKYYIYLIGNPI